MANKDTQKKITYKTLGIFQRTFNTDLPERKTNNYYG